MGKKINETNKETKNKTTNIVDGSFAIYIFKLRTDNKLTQKEFAELIHVSDRTISKWENSLSVPDLIHIRNISHAFGVSPNAIVLDKMSFRDYLRIFLKLIKKLSKILFNNIFKVIFFIIFILLIIFFLNNYNSVNIYTLTYSSDNITIDNSYFIKTSNKNLLLINDINLNYIDYEIEDIKLELYTILNGDKMTIYKEDTLNDISISELNSYSDILSSDVIKSMRKNLFLLIKTIDTNGNEYSYKCTISMKSYFRNDKLIYWVNSKDNNEITSYIKNYDNSLTVNFTEDSFNNFINSEITKNSKKIDNSNIDKEALKEIGYEYDSYNDYYFKMDEDKEITFQPEYDLLFIKYDKESLNYKISYYYETGKIIIEVYENNSVLVCKYKYIIETKLNNCLYGKCPNFNTDINYILEAFQNILSTL